ncbi:MAG: hypothetical protein OWV35_05500, partial [Firmicutes bacterium]|nr:hypothetical protein [Bacillota bacterium]
MIAPLVWTAVLTGFAWADWRTRSVALATLGGVTLLTLAWFPPWTAAAAWGAAVLFFAGSAGYVTLRRGRRPGPAIWGAADYAVAALTIVWLRGAWFSTLCLVLAAFGVQLAWSLGQWLATRTMPARWPWLVGFWAVWCAS